MKSKLSSSVINYLTNIAKERDELINDNNLKISFDKQSIRQTKVIKDRLELLANQLPIGLYTNPIQVYNYIKDSIRRNEKDSLSYSPLITDYPELHCCRPMKYRTGNIITGRDKEIESILLSLIKSSKRSVILTGDPGTGKTAVVRAVNNRLIERTVPRQLNGCYILTLDIPYIYAKHKEDPVGTIIKALERASEYDKAILFIDEVHQLLSHKMNDILKPYLTEKIRFIGSTTIDEYHAIITEDRALERRFTLIPIDEPNFERTIGMIKGTKSVYEEYHKCTIPNEICEYVVVNGSRFLGYRRNPDKSLDLMDIACSIMYEKEIIHKESEADNNEFSLKSIEKRKSEIMSYDEKPGDRVLSQHYVNLAISSVTGIPYGDIKNSLNYSQVCSNISKEILGQEEQIKTISNVVNIFKHVKADRDRPVSVLTIVGPEGVGKTSACKLLAKNLYGRDDYFIEYDMSGMTSEFMITELKGAPPGYVGYKNSGKLVKEIRNCPQSVVYLRGINKAHECIRQYIVDACRRGSIYDSADRVAPLNNAVIIYSVTLDKDEYNRVCKNSNKVMGFSSKTENDEGGKLNKETLEKVIGKELVAASDEVIIFDKLSKETLDQIFKRNISEYLDIYDVDVDSIELKKQVMQDVTNGKEVISKLASEVPKFVFKQLRQE